MQEFIYTRFLIGFKETCLVQMRSKRQTEQHMPPLSWFGPSGDLGEF